MMHVGGGVNTSICYPFVGAMTVTSKFSKDRVVTVNGKTYVGHWGIDIVGKGDETVVSVASGVVKKAIVSRNSYGTYVWVLNDDGKSCIYAHLKSLLCKEGQRVSCKTPLGIMGSTGASTGKHLHFGVFDNQTCSDNTKQAINPAVYFKISYTGNIEGKWLDGSEYCSTKSNVYKSYSDLKANKPDIATYRAARVEGESESGIPYVDATEIYETIKGSGRDLDILYGRRYRIIISDDEGNAIDVSTLRCTFNIVRSWTNNSEVSHISIYNLSPETENKIISKGKTVYVEAGYASKYCYGRIYTGTIIQCLRGRETTDFVLTLVTGDATMFNIQSILGLTVNSNNNMRRAIEETVTRSGNITGVNYGMAVGKLSDRSDEIKLPRGKVLFGRSSKILEQIASSIKSTVYIENGIVNLVSLEEVERDEVFDVSPSSGLIGAPTQTSQGVSITSLLNPQFKLNSLFKLDNRYVHTMEYQLGNTFIPLSTQGLYRVIKLTYTGDTRGKEWFVGVEAINQIGLMPDIAWNGTANVI